MPKLPTFKNKETPYNEYRLNVLPKIYTAGKYIAQKVKKDIKPIIAPVNMLCLLDLISINSSFCIRIIMGTEIKHIVIKNAICPRYGISVNMPKIAPLIADKIIRGFMVVIFIISPFAKILSQLSGMTNSNRN